MIIQPSIMSRSYETLLDLAGVWDMNYHELKKADDPDLVQRCKSDPDNIETFQDFARAGCGNICEGLKQVLDSDNIFLRPDQRKFLFGIIEDLTMMRNLPMDGWVTVMLMTSSAGISLSRICGSAWQCRRTLSALLPISGPRRMKPTRSLIVPSRRSGLIS